MKRIRAGQLEIAYLEAGAADGPPVVLLHGFPYDVHAMTEAGRILAASGHRVLIPWLRGYCPTRFLDDATPRSGEQAALGADLLAFLEALDLPPAVLAGYDWGGRAACIVAALWPDRVRGLVSGGSGYNIQNIAAASAPAAPEAEHRWWYQYYFHGERGRAGLTRNRRDLCRLLWNLWSPDWDFDDATFARTAPAFDNPDFVEVVIHSYRHRYGLVAGDPAHAAIEQRLAAQPPITVPAIVLQGASDGVDPPEGRDGDRRQFQGPWSYEVLPGIGHNIPQEAPAAFARAVAELARR
ncbi:alpha/beta fold hydrolase [Tistrella mobilis]|uniref:alpha/beta fold hydrolase n=1 Tax=Tistrella mobilis TaxID=171437 RepID=UPI0031F711EC